MGEPNETVEVIQADRDLAHEIMHIIRGYRVKLPSDRHFLIDMLAKHRVAVTKDQAHG